ncbi:MAG TPA: GDP-mannose 4,6-dehydratase [Acidimicrobiales bacterium]|nr:GDP-mannose 4,6-dehydratase [Acidimicrobiales bacterium]
MRVLVTGSGGFVGPWLMAHLDERGDEAVPLPAQTDIRDEDAVRTAVVTARPEAICHLAAQSSVKRSWDDPAGTTIVNVVGTLNVCRAAAELETPPRVLVVSSSEVYGSVGSARGPISEAQPFAPVTPYAASKAAAEMVALQAWLGRGLDTVRARAFNHTGPGQGPGFVVPDLASQVAKAARGELSRIATGNLEVSRDLTDVRDVVRAYRLLLLHGEAGEVYNVCRGETVLISDLLRALMKIAGTDVPVWLDPERARPADVPFQVGDHTRLTSLTGWQPEVPLEKTLADILADFGQ